jgi:hypothetical protein
MKALFLFALAVCATAADPVLNGSWQVHQNISGNERDLVCKFSQSGGDLSGSCDFGSGAVPISGKVEDKKVSWSYKSEYNGSPLHVQYSGTLESDKITGTVTVPEYSADGPFTATPAK